MEVRGDIVREKLTINIEVPVSLSHELATVPAQARKWDAGYDITSAEAGYIRAGQRRLLGTGVHLAIPEGYVGFIKPRSGLAFRHGIDVLGGVIDAGFRGEVKVILLNTGDMPFYFSAGDRIAQLVVQPVASVNFVESLLLPESERAEGGFGSTGVN